MMQKIFRAAVILHAVSAAAQPAALAQQAAAAQPAAVPVVYQPNGTSWQNVQNLVPGTSVYVRAQKRHSTCVILRDDADSVTCAGGKGNDVVYMRSEIRTVRVPKRGKSALVASIPGAGLMAVSGVGLATENCKGQFLCGIGWGVALGGGAALVIIGAPIGALTDFMGKTIYKAQ